MPSSFATRAIGRDVSITILTASSLNSDEKLFFGRGNYFTFPDIHPNGWTVRKLRGTPGGRGGQVGGGLDGYRAACAFFCRAAAAAAGRGEADPGGAGGG